MSYGDTSYYYAYRISCVKKNSDNNEVILHVYDVSSLKHTKHSIKFSIFWETDSPEILLEELKNDANIVITNPIEFINLIKIFHKANPRIDAIQNSDSSSVVS